MTCTACGTPNEPGRKFCGECGAPLILICGQCGTQNPPGVKFCGECGAVIVAAPGAAPPGPPLTAAEPIAERRLVSILFADLVGFTSLSEHRDAEFVRELLTRYFDTARRLVERYGGVVEKFIGDAVMAVWGAPVAQEDDAERATRTALDLVAAVAALSDEFGSADLRLRAGVMTGEAAVTLGVSGQGMVAGDLVNTASRVQALADPGAVLVDDATRHATEAAIAYEDAGEHMLKGKTVPTRVHRALRVIAARRGEGRSVGLEPSFVGREREFRLVKELFHAAADERRAMLVSIAGVAGIGKSRLTWEFEKYIDGLANDVLWHRGRCLAYGDGVAYWAIGEMVRMRARIAEDDAPDVARTKLREALQTNIPLAADREFLEPRLAHLIGLAERTAPDKEDLFSAWRLFFERMAERAPVVMVFEDLQWADAGLLDFIEYLLDWSRAYPIYLLTASRPELANRRPSWGAAQRDFTSIFLEPLEAAEVATMLDGLVPGLPADLRGRIVERAEGVPLYAVETVRMLLDRGLVAREGDRYKVTGAVEALAVPETLHALVAARLDGLEPAERRLLGDAAVLGKSFTREGLAALSGQPADALAPVVVSLLRKEILTQQSDPLSPERRQLAFMQDLLRRVTYETMSKRERKGRHLAAAAHLLADPAGDEELAGIVASHYLDAFRAAEDEPDAEELKRTARAMLVRAGERATSLAAGAEAAGYFERAVELSDDPRQRSQLLELAAAALSQAGDAGRAVDGFRRAAALLEEIGEQRAAARVSGRLAEALRFDGRADQALEVLQQAYTALADGPRDADLAFVAAEYARVAFFVDRYELAIEPIELALDLAEALKLPQVLAEALNTKGVLLFRRATESEALIRQAVRVALSHDLPPTALRAQFNLAGLFMEHDRYREATELLHEAIELARRRGYRPWEAQLVTQLADTLSSMGSWDEATAIMAQVESGGLREPLAAAGALLVEARLAHGRGAYERLEELVEELAHLRTAGDRQDQGSYHLAMAIVKRSQGRFPDAIEYAQKAATLSRSLHQLHYATEGFVESVEAAMDAGDLETAERLVAEMEALDLVDHRPLLDAQVSRLRARLPSVQAAGGAEPAFTEATDGFRAITARYWLAVTLCEHGEWLIAHDRRAEAEPLLAESAVLFAELRAQPWLDRLAALDVGIEIAS
jgi:class 3 adenylate cyclase/tetratricopeptide (TPR) repeat protein